MTLASNPACNPACRVCHYKDLPYSTQLERKQVWATKNLERWVYVLNSIRPAPDDEQLAYRAKSWMKLGTANGEKSFGMYRAIQKDGKWGKEFISWDRCPIHTRAIQETMENLRHAFSNADDLIENSLHGIWVGTPHLVFVVKGDQYARLKDLDWKKLLVAPIDRVWVHESSQVGRKIFGRKEIRLVYGPETSEAIHPIRAFRQIAQTLLVEAREKAVQALLQPKPEFVLDLYCGTGDLSLLLPQTVGWFGIEISKDAVAFANSLRPKSMLHEGFNGTVEQRLADPKVQEKIRGNFSLYLNPPRSGLTGEAQEKVLALLREHRPNSVVYLSCSASSLARDLKAFEESGYRIDLLQPYDFFPQTEHFETLAVLRRST